MSWEDAVHPQWEDTIKSHGKEELCNPTAQEVENEDSQPGRHRLKLGYQKRLPEPS